MMQLFSFPTFNLTKILLTAEEIGMDFQFHYLDAMTLEHKSAEHLQRHPQGKVPAAEVNGEYFFESNAICRLACELNNNQLYGETPLQRGRVNQWVDFITLSIGRPLTTIAQEELLKPRVLKQEPNPEAIAEAQQQLNTALATLEEQLTASPFLAGQDITIADTIGFCYAQIQEYTSASVETFPAVQDWYQRIRSRPSFARMMAHLPDGKILPFL